jgi:hypothetical protein
MQMSRPSFAALLKQSASRIPMVVGAFLALWFSPVVSAAQAVSGTPGSGVGTENIFGSIEEPAGVDKYNAQAGANGLGLMVFISNILRLGGIVAGLWVFMNFILAGWTYITAAGDTGAAKKVQDKLTMSVIGLVLIVASYTLAAMLGLLLFGDAGYILNPTIKGVV